jgi:hypothetical protein
MVLTSWISTENPKAHTSSVPGNVYGTRAEDRARPIPLVARRRMRVRTIHRPGTSRESINGKERILKT